MYGYVFQKVNGRSHGNTLRILLFLLNETYTDTRLFVQREQILFLSVYMDDIKMAGQKQNLALMLKKIDERRWHWGTNIISWSRLLWMHPTGKQTQWENYWTIQQDVRIPYLCWSNRKITRMWQTSCTNFSVVLHARKCVERYCELTDKKTEQPHKVSHPCLDDQKRRLGK